MNARAIILFAMLACLVSSMSFPQERKINLSKSAMKTLDEHFGKWNIAGTTEDIYGSDGFPSGKKFVDLTTGNFNADTVLDYAIMVIAPDSIEPKGKLVVLLSNKSGYQVYIIDNFLSYDAPYYVYTVPKGHTVYDENDFTPYKLKRDAVVFGYQEKGGTIYFYDGDKFITYAGSDGC